MYFYLYVYVFLLLYMFRSVYSVSLCCSMYCLCVNVYCTVLYYCHRVSTQLKLTDISNRKYSHFSRAAIVQCVTQRILHTDTMSRRSFWERFSLKYYCYHGIETMPDEGKLERKIFCVESVERFRD